MPRGDFTGPALADWARPGTLRIMLDEGSKGTIDIRVEDISQLFETMDPFPFRQRDLARDADDYVFQRAGEISRHQALEIVVHLPVEAAETEAARSLGMAFSHFFAYRAEIAGRDLSELLRVGRRTLAIGLAVLGLCLVIGHGVSTLFAGAYFARFIEEGLIILGWVANWRPLEIFLYDWWPLFQQRNLYRRLAKAVVTTKLYATAPSTQGPAA